MKGPFSKVQGLIVRTLSQIFPQVQDVHVNYLHPDLLYSTGKHVELDIFIPSLKLAIEYHGEQHFFAHHVAGEAEQQQVL